MKIQASIRFHIDKAGDTLDLDEVCLEVAKDVIAETGGKKAALLEVIAELVAPSVRVSINNRRSAATVGLLNPSFDDEPEPSIEKMDDAPESPRFRRRVSAHEKFLNSHLMTENGYVQVRHCTADDLRYAIAEREEHIARVQYHVNRLRDFVNALAVNGVTTVGELPESALTGVLAPMAA